MVVLLARRGKREPRAAGSRGSAVSSPSTHPRRRPASTGSRSRPPSSPGVSSAPPLGGPPASRRQRLPRLAPRADRVLFHGGAFASRRAQAACSTRDLGEEALDDVEEGGTSGICWMLWRSRRPLAAVGVPAVELAQLVEGVLAPSRSASRRKWPRCKVVAAVGERRLAPGAALEPGAIWRKSQGLVWRPGRPSRRRNRSRPAFAGRPPLAGRRRCRSPGSTGSPSKRARWVQSASPENIWRASGRAWRTMATPLGLADPPEVQVVAPLSRRGLQSELDGQRNRDSPCRTERMMCSARWGSPMRAAPAQPLSTLFGRAAHVDGRRRRPHSASTTAPPRPWWRRRAVDLDGERPLLLREYINSGCGRCRRRSPSKRRTPSTPTPRRDPPHESDGNRGRHPRHGARPERRVDGDGADLHQ